MAWAVVGKEFSGEIRLQSDCEGVAYHNMDATNHGSGALNPANGTYLNEFRMNEGISTSYTKFHDAIDNNPFNRVQPPEGQLYVGWTVPGEWFNLTGAGAFPWIETAGLWFRRSRLFQPAMTRTPSPGASGTTGIS